MSIDRKYRQRGYMDSYREEKGEKEKKGEKPKKPGGARWQQQDAPRAPQMPGRRTVSRCAQCGTVLQTLLEELENCPKCGAEIHSCKQCAHFDPASRFECTQPIKKRIAKKDARNDCQYFELRTSSEREASSSGSRPEDARRAFENLFKK